MPASYSGHLGSSVCNLRKRTMSEYSMRSFTQNVQNRTCSTLTIFPEFRNLTAK
jgi:hypothetical protein